MNSQHRVKLAEAKTSIYILSKVLDCFTLWYEDEYKARTIWLFLQSFQNLYYENFYFI